MPSGTMYPAGHSERHESGSSIYAPNIPCPQCDAPPDSPCRSKTGGVYTVGHVGRFIDELATQEQENDEIQRSLSEIDAAREQWVDSGEAGYSTRCDVCGRYEEDCSCDSVEDSAPPHALATVEDYTNDQLEHWIRQLSTRLGISSQIILHVVEEIEQDIEPALRECLQEKNRRRNETLR